MLEGGGSLKLLDLGVVRVPGLEDAPPTDIPGTQAYMAPEMFEGEPGNEATDIYALGVTMFRAFTGEFPYGNLDATSPARRERPKDITALRPDLPAWLQAVLGRAIARDPGERFRDVMEFALEMEAGPPRAPAPDRRPQTLLERAPVRFWQGVAALLGLALILRDNPATSGSDAARADRRSGAIPDNSMFCGLVPDRRAHGFQRRRADRRIAAALA